LRGLLELHLQLLGAGLDGIHARAIAIDCNHDSNRANTT
jgi:hypothetical protein